MGLSDNMIAEFAKMVNKDNNKTPTETTVNGTAVTYEGRTFVRLDGSDALTPVTPTVSMNDGDRVQVLIKDHTATATGNVSDPAASSKTVKEQGNKIAEFDIIIADKVSVDELEAEKARINDLETDNVVIKNQLTATEADIQNLTAADVIITGRLDANDVSIKNLDTEKLSTKMAEATYATITDLEATDAKIYNLSAVYGDFEVLATGKFQAIEADITSLETDKLSATDADLKYANIDFSNIGHAAMEYFYANSGLIRDVTIDEGTITGHLVGVTIKGDLIEGDTVVADKLVIKGEDGIYYKLNMSVFDTVYYQVAYNSETDEYITTDIVLSEVEGTLVDNIKTIEGDDIYVTTIDDEEIYYCKNVVYNNEKVDVTEVPQDSLNGEVITAKSITADKVSVSDLVAFDATIGGFNITEKSIYSGVKESVNNTTQGVYMDNDGQMAFGDGTNYIKYYKDEDGTYRLTISADSVMFGNNNNLANLLDYIRIDAENGSMTFGAGDNAMALTLDDDIISFSKNGELFGWWDGVNFHTGNIMINVTERAQFGNYAFIPRTDGSLSFLKVENNQGFYTIVSGRTMFLYGTYPTTEDTTLVLSDISVTAEDNTLILGGE